MYEDIEKVTVNGMTMWKWGNQLFLTKDEAKREVRKLSATENPRPTVMSENLTTIQ